MWQTYLTPWRLYARFTGRAGRREYWTFTLGNTLVYGVLEIILFRQVAPALTGSLPTPPGAVGTLVSLALDIFWLVTLIPGLAVWTRRLHDTDRSGWWCWLSLIPIVGTLITLVWLCQRGTPGANRFGPAEPLDPVRATDAERVIP